MFYASGRVFGISFGELWRDPQFVKLWAGETISRFGSEISLLAIPLTAALVLNASPFQMGLYRASNLFGNGLQAVYVLYVTRELGIGPALLGLMAMAVCSMLAPLWVLFSPVRMLRTQPAPV